MCTVDWPAWSSGGLSLKYTCLSAGRVVPECIVILVTWDYSLFKVCFLPSVSFGLQHL